MAMQASNKQIYGYEFGACDFKGRMAYTLFFRGCNLRCPFCYNKEIVEAGEGKLTVMQMYELIAGKSKFIPNLGVVLSGGEPTVNPDFEQAVELLRRFSLGIHTNGLVLPKMVNPFESVVLSVKEVDEIGAGMTRNEYYARLGAALDYYIASPYKEIRIVASTKRETQLDMVKPLILGDVTKDWNVNIVPERR